MCWLFFHYGPEETVYGWLVPEGVGVVDFAFRHVGVKVGRPDRISMRRVTQSIPGGGLHGSVPE